MRPSRDRVLARYRSLGWGELVAAVAFAGIGLGVVAPRLSDREVIALSAALAPLLLILVQAGVYWLLARAWVGRERMPASIAVVYGALRIANPVVLSLALGGIVVCWPERGFVAVGVLGVWAFGVVEYVNYFVVQLARPTAPRGSTGRGPNGLASNWLRTPRLARDIRAAQKR